MLGGLLLALQLWLPASAFAIARQNPSAPSQDIARAGVSVVRLLVSYSLGKAPNANATASRAECTGLGVLLSSQLKSDTQKYENWVLTDGNLVNSEEQATCLDATPTATLSRIDIFMNTSYSSQPVTLSLTTAPVVTCRPRPAHCSDGPALFSFLSDRPQPFLDLSVTSPGGSAVAGHNALQLASSDITVGMLNPSSQDAKRLDEYKKQIQAFLVPTVVSSTGNRGLESGAPYIDSSGALAGLYLLKAPPMTADDIQSFVNSGMPNILKASNPVHDNWNNGMNAYYNGLATDKNMTTQKAHYYFAQAFQANPQFDGAKRFADLSSTQIVTGQARKVDAPVDQPSPFPLPSWLKGNFHLFGFPIAYWQVAVAAIAVFFVLLILLVIVLTTLARRRRRKRMADDLAHAQRLSEIEAPRIAEKEARRANEVPHTNGLYNAPNGQLQPPVPIQYSPANQQPMGEQEPFPPATAPLAGPSTHPLSPSLADQPTIVPLTEQPTMDMATMSQDTRKGDLEKTVPYSVRHLNGQHLGFVVGTRSDPGIKRKYKPNEDSLFAAQGILPSQPQLFGLFVVADGMGGHANGEDASQLAIQTIANSLLPRLTQSSALKDEQYIQLLVEGIQQANLAVHQNNVQQHGDMGTTVTATLLVDTVAYVANVGDSRTYLYRPSEGLKKVTVDHSVVASLVEAGIIKPDDIYTHPKRNQIYRSLGEKASVEVDAFTVQLQAGDKLLLCSDGLWDMVRDPQIEAVIKNTDPNPSVTGEALIQSALDGGGEDNVSVIVVQVTEGLQSSMPRFKLLTKPDSVHLPQL
jgi:serine/threonine protein phosphatase PrpC